MSAKYVNNETPIIDAEPISTMLTLNVADNIIDSSNTSSDNELPQCIPPHLLSHNDPDIHEFPSTRELKDATDCHWVVAHVTPLSWKKHLRDISIKQLCDIYNRAYMHQAVLDNMLNSRTQELISALHKARASCDTIREREIKRDKAYAELEKKCNEALQDLDKNPLVSDMHSEIKTLQGQTLSILHAKVEGLESKKERLKASEIQMLQDINSLRQDRVVIVLKVVPDASMKLVHSDEMGVLIARLVRAAIIHGRCTAFEEVDKLKEPFVLENMLDYRTSSKDEYDQAREDMANASYPLLSEFTSNPYAFVEQLLSMKPQSLRSLNAL
ncbi:hypothetical protein Tco_0889557 [Tanacetum coccineum]